VTLLKGRLNHQTLVTDIKLLGEVQRLGGGAGGARVSGTAGGHWPATHRRTTSKLPTTNDGFCLVPKM
jgi:hypothetical protein